MVCLTEVVKILNQFFNLFKCFRCSNIFENKYASKTDKDLCKYCEELDDNGELKEEM